MNLLNESANPYLQAQADQPVDWQPWGQAALEQAQDESKPIFLFIGCATSIAAQRLINQAFYNSELAVLLNSRFVTIFVDRQERADIDRIYQLAHSALTQKPGGWPLVSFLSNDQTPFFTSTQFGDDNPELLEVVRQVLRMLDQRSDQIAKQNQQLQAMFARINTPVHDASVTDNDMLSIMLNDLLGRYDRDEGGFGLEPKFPHCSALQVAGWLAVILDTDMSPSTLQIGSQTINRETAAAMLHEVVQYSLKAMLQGGLIDHVNHGVFSYCIDRDWNIPSFEKPLLTTVELCLTLQQLPVQFTADEQVRYILESHTRWLSQFHNATGFISRIIQPLTTVDDAPVHYYGWTLKQLQTALSPSEFAFSIDYFGLQAAPNGRLLNAAYADYWVLQPKSSLHETAQRLQSSTADVIQQLNAVQQRLARSYPVEQDQDLCSIGFNALCIKTLIVNRTIDDPLSRQAYAQLETLQQFWLTHRSRYLPRYLPHAMQVDYTYTDKADECHAFLDDYAYLLDCLVTLLQHRWSSRLFRWAIDLAQVTLQRFEDSAGGYYFIDETQAMDVLHRPMILSDEVGPSGAAVLARNLTVLGYLLNQQKFLRSAESAVTRALPAIKRAPMLHGQFFQAWLHQHQPPHVIVVRAPQAVLDDFHQRLKPGLQTLTFFVPETATALPARLLTRENPGEIIGYFAQGEELQHKAVGETAVLQAMQTH